MHGNLLPQTVVLVLLQVSGVSTEECHVSPRGRRVRGEVVEAVMFDCRCDDNETECLGQR